MTLDFSLETMESKLCETKTDRTKRRNKRSPQLQSETSVPFSQRYTEQTRQPSPIVYIKTNSKWKHRLKCKWEKLHVKYSKILFKNIGENY